MSVLVEIAARQFQRYEHNLFCDRKQHTILITLTSHFSTQRWNFLHDGWLFGGRWRIHIFMGRHLGWCQRGQYYLKFLACGPGVNGLKENCGVDSDYSRWIWPGCLDESNVIFCANNPTYSWGIRKIREKLTNARYCLFWLDGKIKSKLAKPEHAWSKPSCLMNLTYLGLSSGLSLDLS